MTDGTGTIVWSADYKPFGEATVTVSTITNNLRFPGQYYDAETGLHYNYFRDYNPALGRYIEADPLLLVFLYDSSIYFIIPLFSLSPNRFNYFAYAANNPNTFFDFFGLSFMCGQHPKKEDFKTDCKYWRAVLTYLMCETKNTQYDLDQWTSGQYDQSYTFKKEKEQKIKQLKEQLEFLKMQTLKITLSLDEVCDDCNW